MADSFFFYDLETSGFSPRSARVMQFGGQRTNLALERVGEPVNLLIKLTPDVLPDPDAVLVTGITPQQTLADGLTEAEFLKFFFDEVIQPGTIFTGFNSVRFDDEFMRFLLYRNFYDAYEWQWKDGNSRWDLLDVVRLTRALRPKGIEWPFAPDGKPSNRLEYLSSVNKLEHSNAHDALADVQATIDVARLIRDKQPELFNYLLEYRDKKAVKGLVEKGAPFVYTSGKYSSQFFHTTAAVLLAKRPRDEVLVYDLRFDPLPFADMSVDQLAEAWRFTRDPAAVRLPIKTVKYNRCPAVAPLGVMKDASSQARISLDMATVETHFENLKRCRAQLAEKMAQVVARRDAEREKAQVDLLDNQLTVDERLYEGFVGDGDKTAMRAVRAAPPEELASLAGELQDERLKNLLPLYKARNYPAALTAEERAAWDEFCAKRLVGGGSQSRLAAYFGRLEALSAEKRDDKQKYLLEELRLYGESIVPADAAD
ncbi:MAG TPA: exodeoxyribonuclease I [Candidatus Saccharimonadales bacterium]|nr:exodeoxyribonuclease I [Candidatus Saccharimonadales bacterium]